MFGLFQNTPQYAGNGQPAANGSGGALGFLSGLFAFPGTPMYAAADRVPPSPATGATFAPVQPTDLATACEQMTSEEFTPQPACSVPLPVAIVIQRSEASAQ